MSLSWFSSIVLHLCLYLFLNCYLFGSHTTLSGLHSSNISDVSVPWGSYGLLASCTHYRLTFRAWWGASIGQNEATFTIRAAQRHRHRSFTLNKDKREHNFQRKANHRQCIFYDHTWTRLIKTATFY